MQSPDPRSASSGMSSAHASKRSGWPSVASSSERGRHTRARRILPVIGALLIGIGTVLGGPASGQANASRRTPGSVSVAYAGSLAWMNDQLLGPSFTRLTHIAYQGRGGGSFGLAREIASGEFTPGVFESVGTGPLGILHGRFTDWAVAVAGTPLVVAYSRTSHYAPEFRKIAQGKLPLRDLFLLMARPGFRLARTNPVTDPQGQAFVEMVELAARVLHLPKRIPGRILGSLENRRQIFAEESELFEIQAGAVDAGSAFLPAARERHLPYILLGPKLDFADPRNARLYRSVSLRLPSGRRVTGAPLAVYAAALKGPDLGAGVRFVTFLLSQEGRRLLRSAGYPPPAVPAVWGKEAALPPAVRKALDHRA